MIWPVAGSAALAQQLDLSRGGPVTVTATDGLELRQNEQKVIARGNARAVRENVTVDADQLIALYRKKSPTDSQKPGQKETAAAGAGPAGPAQPRAGQTTDVKSFGPQTADMGQQPPKPDPANAGEPKPSDKQSGSPPGAIGTPDASSTEVYRVEAENNVRIYTPTDRAQGDHAVYDMDQAVLVMTGHDLRLTTPDEVITARDSLEYWSQKHMAAARGNAVVVTKDARRISADTLVAYTTEGGPPPATPDTSKGELNKNGPIKPAATAPQRGTAASGDPLVSSGKLKKVEAFGNVSIRTQTEIVTGDRAVYVPETGIARLAGHVRITRGQNQINGAEAEVNLKTGVSRLLSGQGGRVEGLIVPNDPTNQKQGDVDAALGGQKPSPSVRKP